MSNYWRISFSWTVIVLSSCATQPSGRGPALPAQSSVKDTVPATAHTAERGIIADTEEMLIPNPIERTENRLYIVRTYLIRCFRRTNRLPEHFTECLPPRQSISHPLDKDSWGKGIVYSRTGDRFELRSAGPDGRLRTSDDLVISEVASSP